MRASPSPAWHALCAAATLARQRAASMLASPGPCLVRPSFCRSLTGSIDRPQLCGRRLTTFCTLLPSDLAVHIDGWISAVAHSVVAQEDPAAPIPEGKQRDVIMACATAAEAILANIKPGVTNNAITPLFQRAAEQYGVNVCEGVLSHQMKRFVIDGNKCIISKTVPGEQAVDDEEFEENDVIGIDIIMSSGEGKPKEVDEKKQMVFKRAVDKNYSLKMKVPQNNDRPNARTRLSGRYHVARCLR